MNMIYIKYTIYSTQVLLSFQTCPVWCYYSTSYGHQYYSVSVFCVHVFSSTTGYWKFCCNSQRHSTDAAELWHWAGRDWAAWRGEGHRVSPRVSHWKVQETQSEVSNVFMQDAFILKMTTIIFFFYFFSALDQLIFIKYYFECCSFSKCLNCSVWQDAIKSVSKEGRHLLSSLEISGKEDESQWDVRMDWETVQRSLIIS